MPASETAISWTDATWNPWHGCFRVSRACSEGAGCYAEKISLRLDHTDETWTAENADENVNMQPHHIEYPTTLNEPQRVFVNSMSDFFLPPELLPDERIHRAMDVMEECPEHVFQVLTKHGCETGDNHPDEPRILQWDREFGRWPDNLWLGVTCETKRQRRRIDMLRQVDAATRWVSVEPLLEPIGMPDLEGIDWVVVGGQSGDRCVSMRHEWVWPIREACIRDGVPFYFKQSSGSEQGANPYLTCRDLVQRKIRELPDRLPQQLCEARPELADQVVSSAEAGGPEVEAPSTQSTSNPTTQTNQH